ncbi:hypothetical protein D0B88_08495 [Cellvibrio sp. KY-YJ-3]|nr:hypothetical protein D0B88_08495 [Cellvibrio sp. KY-YJ-3]
MAHESSLCFTILDTFCLFFAQAQQGRHRDLEARANVVPWAPIFGDLPQDNCRLAALSLFYLLELIPPWL